MTLTIESRHIGMNRPRSPLTPAGLVIHTTANPGADADTHFAYWDSANRDSSAHLVVDWSKALELLPWRPGEAEMAWHAGAAANRTFLGLEICETDDPAQFERTWQNAVDVCSQVLRAYSWGPERLLAHAQVSWWWGGTDHTDPLPWLQRWNRTWGDLVGAVDRALRGIGEDVPGTVEPTEPPQAEEWQQEAVAALTRIALPGGQRLLSAERPARQAVEWWELATMLQRVVGLHGIKPGDTR